jgi:uncharacterized protein (TIGR02246 family)
MWRRWPQPNRRLIHDQVFMPVATKMMEPTPQYADEQSVREIETLWDGAWNRHDADALAELLVEDVDFINVTGAWFKSRAEFRERMAQTHRGVFKDSKRQTLETSVRFLSPDIAIVHARWEMSGLRNRDGSAREPWQGIITRVVLKRNGNWLVVAAHNIDLAATVGGGSSPVGL